ncbi:MAG: HEAT repeat domain-containing protein [Elusimicrobia bacterium]|nr:HEAT repeat domain-containing protein [Elusimicrobiota bacterium]
MNFTFFFTYTFVYTCFIAFNLCAGQAPPHSVGGQAVEKDTARHALQIVITELKNADSDAREKAVKILGDAGNKGAVPVLKKRLKDISKYVQIAAAESLWKLGDNSGIKRLYEIIADVPGRNPIADTALVQMKIISMNKIRERAVETLVRIRKNGAEETLFELKNDFYGEIRDAAARELARLGYGRELDAFHESLGTEDEGLRYQAALSISRICIEDSAGYIREALKKEKAMRVKIALLDAAQCLGSRSKKKVLSEALRLSSDENPTIRFKSALILSDIFEKAALEKTKEIYESTKDLNVKIAAMIGIIKAGETPDFELIRQTLYSTDVEAKNLALKAVEDMDPDKAGEFLNISLKDSSAFVRLEAARQILKRRITRQD